MIFNYSLKDFLIASPYNTDTNFDGKLSEDLFFEDYFVRPSTYETINKNFDLFLNSTTQRLSASFFLYGYSGTGKTTYLKWYGRNRCISYNLVFFDLAEIISSENLSDIGDSSYENSLKLFDIFYYKLLCEIFQKYPEAVNNLLSTIYKLQLSLVTTFSMNFFNKLHNYFKAKEINVIDPNKFMNFAFSCSYIDLLTLLLFFYYYYPEKFGQYFNISIDKSQPLLIIFDNLDHVEIEYHNSRFPKNIETVYQNVKQVIIKNENIEVNKIIKFVFCLRDANYSIINCQLDDITSRMEVEFTPIQEESEIFSKRISLAKKNNVKLDPDQCGFLKFVLNDEYTNRSFQPLFNFNIRKLAEFLCDMIQETESTYVQDIKDLSRNRYTKNGSRGIEYFLLIKHLLKTNYLKRRLFLIDDRNFIGTHGGFVNPARILLTNILNGSQYSLDEYTRSSACNQIGLYDLFISFNEVFEGKVDLFFEIITSLFLFHNANWCHLITFSNKQVLNEDAFCDEKAILENLIKHSENQSSVDIDKLNKIQIRLNPAGFVYVRDITKHYEFFSIRAGNKYPLFSSLNYNEDMKEFEFFLNIKKTFNLTEDCINHLIKFLKYGASENFTNSNNCFRVYNKNDEFDDDQFERRKSGLHSIRIIDTHIRYIDTFRYFILNDDRWLSKLGTSDIIAVKRDINEKILTIIEKYVNFLKEINQSADSTENLRSIFSKNISIVKTSGYYDFRTSVNKGRT